MAATVVSRNSATSAADQLNTSHNTSAARCRGGRCCRAVTKARRTDSFWTASSAGSPVGSMTFPSAIGVTQGASGRSGPRNDSSGGDAGPSLHGPGPALHLAGHVDAHIGGDAVEPRAHTGAALESRRAAERLDHRLLHRILGLEAGAEHAVAVARQFPPVRLEVGQLQPCRDSHAWRLYQCHDQLDGWRVAKSSCLGARPKSFTDLAQGSPWFDRRRADQR